LYPITNMTKQNPSWTLGTQCSYCTETCTDLTSARQIVSRVSSIYLTGGSLWIPQGSWCENETI